MTPEQLGQVAMYSQLIPTLDKTVRKYHRRKVSIFLEQDGLCCLCEKPMKLKYKGSTGLFATYEHIVCKSVGGTNERTNTPLSHGFCNSKRGTQDFEKFKAAAMAGKILEEPHEGREKQRLHAKAQRGDSEAIEYFIAKRLGQLLRLDMMEDGLIVETMDYNSRALLRHKLEFPMNFGVPEFIIVDGREHYGLY